MQYEMAEYTVMLYDLGDQPVMDISRYVSFNLNLKLNDTSTFNFSIDGRALEQLCAAIDTTPRQVLYPNRTEIKVYRNDNIKFGGIISQVTPTYGENSISVDVSADSYIQYFAKRLLNKNYTATDRSVIAWDAIDTVQSVTYGDLGVTQGVLATTYPSDLTADYRDVKSIIQLYTYAQPTTYDFEITPDKVFNTYTRLGSDKPEIELVYPQNIISISIPRNGDTQYNKVVGIGAGIGKERKQSIKEDAVSQLTYRVQETKQLFSSVDKQTTLDDNTDGVLEQSKGILELPEIVVSANDIQLDTTNPGDSVYVKIENSTLGDDVNGMYRIYEMAISVDVDGREKVSVKFYNPQSGGEIEQG